MGTLNPQALQDWKSWAEALKKQTDIVVAHLDNGRYLDAQNNYEELVKALEVKHRRDMLSGTIKELGPGKIGP